MRAATAALSCLAVAIAVSAAGCGPGTGPARPFAGQSVEVAGSWTGAEQATFERVLSAFGRQSGAKVRYVSGGSDLGALLSARVAGEQPPDVAMIPQPGVLARYVAMGAAKPITGAAAKAVADHFSPQWQRLGSIGGRLYGVYVKAANKSVIWYRTDAFAAAGVAPPRTLDELTTVSQTLADSGTAAMTVPGADGWPLTDWFENLYLRLAGPDRYDRLATHELSWTDPSVVEALRAMGRYWATPGFLRRGALQTTFTGSVADVFGPKPISAMLFEGDFVTTEITKLGVYRVAEDARYFPWPSPDGTGNAVVAGGDAAVAFTARPVTMALMAFLASPQAAELLVGRGGFLSVNDDLDPRAYPDPATRSMASALSRASVLRFDLSDLTPAAFGGGNGSTMWRLLQEYLAAPGTDPAVVAARLEQAAIKAYGVT